MADDEMKYIPGSVFVGRGTMDEKDWVNENTRNSRAFRARNNMSRGEEERARKKRREEGGDDLRKYNSGAKGGATRTVIGKPPELLKPGTISDEEVAKALIATLGNLSATARILDQSRRVIEYRVRMNSELNQLAEELKETRTDTVVDVLYKLCLQENATAVLFYLETQAKDRGYVRRVDKREVTLNIDWSSLTHQQLLRIRQGENPERVLAEAQFAGNKQLPPPGDSVITSTNYSDGGDGAEEEGRGQSGAD